MDSFADLLWHVICRVHFICYLYLRLPEDTLAQVSMQEQRCALNILWLQLDGLLWTVSAYHNTGIPNQWFSALATTIHQLAVQVDTWHSQLVIDLAHLNPPNPMASAAQESLIAMWTRSHYPSYESWYHGR